MDTLHSNKEMIVRLIDTVRTYLNKEINNTENIFFVKINERILLGSVKGLFVCLVISSDQQILSSRDITLSSKIIHSGGEFYTIRTFHDLLEIAKVRGWHD